MTSTTFYEGTDPRTGAHLKVGIQNGTIVSLESCAAELRSAHQRWIAPGLIDLQVNGFAGYDFNSDTPEPDQIVNAAHRLLAEGVTTFVPTIVTGSHEQIAGRIVAIVRAREQAPLARSMIPYVHLEGPHISDQDGARGVHDQDYVRPPSLPEFDDWQQRCGGLIGLLTLSPHYPESAEYIAALVDRGVHVAIGHTHAGSNDIDRAAAAGARLSTHLGNGAHPLLPRHPNYIWDQLADDRLTAGFIADGHHLPAPTLKAMVRAKGYGRCILVSDSVALAGSRPGTYDTPIGGRVELTASGRLAHVDSGLLAGASRSLAYGVATVANSTDLDLSQALDLATAAPGRFAGGCGTLAVGQRADMIVFHWRPGSPRLDVITTVKSGRSFDGLP